MIVMIVVMMIVVVVMVVVVMVVMVVVVMIVVVMVSACKCEVVTKVHSYWCCKHYCCKYSHSKDCYFLYFIHIINL
jgi:hypothetical protein